MVIIAPCQALCRDLFEDRWHIPIVQQAIIKIAIGGRTVGKEAIRPGRPWHRRKPPVAYSELLREGRQHRQPARVKTFHDCACCCGSHAGLLRIAEHESLVRWADGGWPTGLIEELHVHILK